MNRVVKCILLDDELPGLTYLRMLCEQISQLEVVRAYENPIKFLEDAAKLDYELCIMDIDMPGLNGLEVARLQQGKHVIFTTAHSNYAAEAFDLEAVDYIRKPITKERLEKAVQKAATQLEKKTAEKQFVQWNTQKGKTLLYFSQVRYITTSESDKRDKLAILDNGEQLILKNISFNELLEVFPSNLFCRVNKKDVIALKSVKFYTHDEIVIQLGGIEKKLPFSENFKKEFADKTRG